MEPPPDFKSAVERAAALNLELINRYRELARELRNPAVGRLVQSVLDQKAGQADLLKTVAGSPDTDRTGSATRAPMPERASGFKPKTEAHSDGQAGMDPALELLRAVQVEEAGMEAVFDKLRESTADEEYREKLHSLAETSRKIGGWARDHLELLRLF